ncbi:hypothetical protein PJO47_29595, partial [Mycobacterium kansasii]
MFDNDIVVVTDLDVRAFREANETGSFLEATGVSSFTRTMFVDILDEGMPHLEMPLIPSDHTVIDGVPVHTCW